MARKRKAFTMAVTVTAPHWCSAAEARKAVREQISHSTFEYYLEGPNFENGRLLAKRVAPMPKGRS